MERHDLRAFDGWVTKSDWPAAQCPTCRLGTLVPTQLDGCWDAGSRQVQSDPDWEPEWISGTFHGYLTCGRCNETVSVVGDYCVAPGSDGVFEDQFALRFARPALRVVAPPDGTPETVVEALDRASALLWVDPSAAANRLRVAIEELLTAQRVRKYPTGKRHVKDRLNTHARIELLERQPKARDALMAVKWVGNSGSHEMSMSVADVLESASFLDLALRLLYDQKDAQLERRVAQINQAKGIPRRRPRGRKAR